MWQKEDVVSTFCKIKIVLHNKHSQLATNKLHGNVTHDDLYYLALTDVQLKTEKKLFLLTCPAIISYIRTPNAHQSTE